MDALVSSLGKRGITLERKVVKYEIKLGLTFMVPDIKINGGEKQQRNKWQYSLN
jgi:hypothetical protein